MKIILHKGKGTNQYGSKYPNLRALVFIVLFTFSLSSVFVIRKSEDNFIRANVRSYDVYAFEEVPANMHAPAIVELSTTSKNDSETTKAISIPSTLKKLFTDTFNEDASLMCAIAKAESGLKTYKINSNTYEYSVGILQINLRAENGEGKLIHWDKVPGADLKEKTEWLMIPENNMTVARFIKATQGLTAWSVYTNGAYKEFLEECN